MNIFFIHEDPIKAAKMQCDKHVVKMILESAQMLCTAHRMNDGKKMKVLSKNGRNISTWVVSGDSNDILYKSAHPNHPSTIWVRSAADNYQWLYKHFVSLCKEYTFRYGRHHLSETKLLDYLAKCPENIASGGTEVPLAMPDEFKELDKINAYRRYYKHKKDTIDMRWTKRTQPEWI